MDNKPAKVKVLKQSKLMQLALRPAESRYFMWFTDSLSKKETSCALQHCMISLISAVCWGPAKFFGSGPWWPPWAPGAMEARRCVSIDLLKVERSRLRVQRSWKIMKDHERSWNHTSFIFFHLRSDVVCISPCSADCSCSWAACRQYVSLAVWYLLLVMEYIVVRIVCQLLVGLWPSSDTCAESTCRKQ